MICFDLGEFPWTLVATGNLDGVPEAVRGQRVPASVPGCVHTALLSVGLIDDPVVGFNEKTQHWIGDTDWQYRCSFDLPEKMLRQERVELVCDGLDTVATLVLNGVEIGRGENMHVGYRFDARHALRPGANELVVTFASPNAYAQAMRRRLGDLPNSGNSPLPYQFIRKMACNFGWDWGPCVVTSGIWRSIRLEAWTGARIAEVRPLVVRATEDEAIVDVHVRLDGVASADVVLSGHGAQTRAVVDGTGVARLHIPNPQRWWPVGHGPQPLYELTVTAGADIWSRRIGLREVRLDTSADAVGSKFTLHVNGKPIFCRGFDWIPDDIFLDRAFDATRYRTRIEQALAANANMLRVWGGGIYESDAFYEICDETGMLVWQDFLFACAAYPEEEPMRSLVEQEPRYNVARLSPHPSLVLWNGCNENVWGYHDWACFRELHTNNRTWGPGYYFGLLPAVMSELDPSRPYWGASPWSGDVDVANGRHPNLAAYGNKHVWEVWGTDYRVYRSVTPRFTSEFGFHAPANRATLARVIPTEEMRYDSPHFRHRQRSPKWDQGIVDRVNDIFKPDADRSFEELHYLLQLNQARALQLGVEWFRSRMPTCMGTLYWQLNDCWPCTSWSAIDSDGRLKLLYYATRRFYAPRLLTIQPRQDMLELCAINDTDEPWEGTYRLFLVNLHVGGRKLIRAGTRVVAPRSTARYALPEAAIVRPREPEGEVLLAELEGAHRALWFYRDDRDLKYPPPQAAVRASWTDDGVLLECVADSFLRDLTVILDDVLPSATASDQLVTLLPGERWQTLIRPARSDPDADVLRRLQHCLRCAAGKVGGALT